SIVERIGSVAWFTARAEQKIAKLGDKRAKAFSKAFREALPKVESDLQVQVKETPYGVPYRPHIWGAGWDIQSFGYRHYFLASAYPEIFSKAPIFNALNFILGCHPGSNQASFASGVGAESATVGYGLNRADWSYIPGGVISGTALIRPDFPELLTFPFLWQQTEYVMGGGSSHYMFLVLAAQQFLKS
ncbi:MAG: glycoside hydrolase, partial [Alistipes sp.]|nr:glycoside hydrolase [Alistipes sp.]